MKKYCTNLCAESPGLLSRVYHNKFFIYEWALILLLLLFSFCSYVQADETLADKTLKVFVSIVPQKYFLEKIGGNLVEISIMVLPGSNPSAYEPRPLQMATLTKTDLYFAIDVPFEKVWLNRFSKANPKMAIIYTHHGIDKISMESGHHHDEHVHQGIKDPHIWLSPPLVKIQAENILSGLIKADPEHKTTYSANYHCFLEEIDNLDLNIRSLFSGEVGVDTHFMVYHPSWGYFAQAYGLTQVPIEMEGKEPSAKELMRFMKQAREKGIKTIFVQPQFSQKSAQTIADAIGGHLLIADPLAENWAKNLLKVTMDLKTSLTE